MSERTVFTPFYAASHIEPRPFFLFSNKHPAPKSMTPKTLFGSGIEAGEPVNSTSRISILLNTPILELNTTRSTRLTLGTA